VAAQWPASAESVTGFPGALAAPADPRPGEDHTGGGLTLRRPVGSIPEWFRRAG